MVKPSRFTFTPPPSVSHSLSLFVQASTRMYRPNTARKMLIRQSPTTAKTYPINRVSLTLEFSTNDRLSNNEQSFGSWKFCTKVSIFYCRVDRIIQRYTLLHSTLSLSLYILFDTVCSRNIRATLSSPLRDLRKPFLVREIRDKNICEWCAHAILTSQAFIHVHSQGILPRTRTSLFLSYPGNIPNFSNFHKLLRFVQ